MIRTGIIYEVPDEFCDPEKQQQIFAEFQEYMRIASEERRRIISDEQLIQKIHDMERTHDRTRNGRNR